MSLAKTLLSSLQGAGTLGTLTEGGMRLGGKFLVQAKNILLSPWSKFSANTDADSMVKLAKIGGGALLGVWSASNGLRAYEEGRAAFHNTGNNEGSSVYSGIQATLFGASALLPTLAMLAPGALGLGLAVQSLPVLAAIPGALALGMDHFQGLATADENHGLAKLGQMGMSNWLIETKAKDNSVLMSRSKLLPWWYRNVRALDEKVMHTLGYKDFKRSQYAFA